MGVQNGDAVVVPAVQLGGVWLHPAALNWQGRKMELLTPGQKFGAWQPHGQSAVPPHVFDWSAHCWAAVE